MADVTEITVRDPVTIRDDILRTIRAGLINAGVASPNVTPGSDYYIIATALANECAVVEANSAIAVDELLVDTATGENLDRLLSTYGLSRRLAGGSVGTCTLESSSVTTVTSGTYLVDPSGLRYQVTVGGVYSNGDDIPIAAVDTGFATNLEADTTLRWVSPPAFSASTAVVGSGGLVNGTDEEDDEAARQRLAELLSNPPTSGNWSHCNLITEESDPSVQKSFCYPAVYGAGTMHLAVTAAPTATNKSREVDSTKLSGVIDPYVRENLPEGVNEGVYITTVRDLALDVALRMALPSAAQGGGWVNSSPFPKPPVGSACLVTAVTSNSEFTFNNYAGYDPIVGVTKISWLSPLDWKLYTGTVTSFSDSGSDYTVTVDTPFVDIFVDCLVMPPSLNLQLYCDTALDYFARLGPGAIASADSRRPKRNQSWNDGFGFAGLRAISDSDPNVLALEYDQDYTGVADGPAYDGNEQTLGPRCFVPQHFAIYELES